MKQFFLFTNTTLQSNADLTNGSLVTAGKIGFYHLDEPLTALNASTPVTKNFGIVVSKGADVMPLRFPEVDIKTLQVAKASYKAGSKFQATITIPTTIVGNEYTIVIAKKNVVFHERNTWSYTQIAKAATSAEATRIAGLIKDSINANSETSGVTATNNGAAITITGGVIGADYTVKGADGLLGVNPTGVVVGKPEMLGTSYVKDLASRCAAGKGFNYTAEDASEIYPGYPENIPEDKGFTMWTLRFAVPRVGAKQRDEVVYQLVHLVCPNADKNTPLETLDTILGLKSAAPASVDPEESK